MTRIHSLRSRISLSIAIVALLAVALICLLSNILLGSQFERYAEEQRRLRAEDIAQNISMLYYPVTKTWDTDAIHALGMYSMADGYIVVVRGADGAIVWDAQNHDMARCAEIMDDIAARMEQYGARGEFTPRDFTLEQNGRTVGGASVTSYGPFFFSEADAALLDSLNRILVIVGLIALAAAVAAGFALARRVSKPALEAARAAERIADGDFAARIDSGSGIRELDELIDSVNRLASDLGKQRELRKRLTADMAHELRTPLAAISVQIESMAEGAAEPTPERLAGCRDEINRLTNLIAGLERLEEAGARGADTGRGAEDTDVAALVRSVCAAWEGKAALKNIALEIEETGAGPVTAKIDGDAIAGAVSNLISNAVKYAPDGGRVRVSVRHGDRRTVVIAIEDNGPGIPEDELPYVFERLYRADKSRNRATGGAGIGLAIAREAVVSNGGSIKAENAPGGGAVFRIVL